jgi:DNA-binding transcriptional regulator of glucitol operon
VADRPPPAPPDSITLEPVRKVLAPRWWLLHLFVAAAVYAMLRLGLWQWHRAHSQSGGIQNYAYAFQWPLFAVFGIVLWVKTMQDEVRRPAGADRRDPRTHHVAPDATIIRRPGVRVGITTQVTEADEDDPEVAAWNARLAALNAATADLDSRKR